MPSLFPPKNDLTNDQVQYIIEMTAEKVGGYTQHNDPSHFHWNFEMGYGRINVARALDFARGEIGRVSRDYALAVQILLGLRSGGAGVVLQGGHPVPVDPGWLNLTPETRDVLLGLAITELAEEINDRETRWALGRAGWNAIERTAQRMGQDS